MYLSAESIAELVKTYANPPRNRLEDMTSITARHRNPRAAWEALSARNAIPDSWMDAPERFFSLPRTFHKRRRALEALDKDEIKTVSFEGNKDYRVAHVPTNALWAAQIASEHANIQTAEMLAREFVAAVLPLIRATTVPSMWKPPEPKQIVWLFPRARLPRAFPFYPIETATRATEQLERTATATLLSPWTNLDCFKEKREHLDRFNKLLSERKDLKNIPLASVLSGFVGFAFLQKALEATGRKNSTKLTKEQQEVYDPKARNPFELLLDLYRTGHILVAVANDGIFLE